MSDVPRPRTRSDCRGHEGPCPFISCAHHLYLDVSQKTGAIILNFPDIAPDALEQMPATCALDVADGGGETLERVGEIMNMTRERVRQYEQKCYAKIRHRLQVHAEEREVGRDRGLAREHSEIARDMGPSHQDARDAFGAFDDLWRQPEFADD